MKIYSGLDLCSAFYQVPTAPDVWDYLSVVTPPTEIKEKIDIQLTNGDRTVVEPGVYHSFTHLRLPMGMHASPSHFSNTLSDTLRRHVPEYFNTNILQFADDLCIMTETYQEHWDVLSALFRGLDSDGWTLARSKAFMFQRSLRFLGLIVSSAGVDEDGTTGVAKLYGDKQKVETILNLKRPADLTELRSFLGACNFFRIFVPAFSLIASPLVKMTKQGVNIKEQWGEEEDRAFRDLKLAIATAGAVTPYCPQKEVIIQVDACRLGVGAVLCQIYGAKARPVAFFSKAYREPAWQWKGPGTDQLEPSSDNNKRPKQKPGSSKPPQALELRGIVEAVLHWRNYCIGNTVGIKILSDHGSLRYIESQRSKGLCSDQTERWCNFLSSVQAQVSWRAGAGLAVADYLSRHGHDERSWDELNWISKYDGTDEGMKPANEVLKEASYDAYDFGASCDAAIDRKLYGGGDELMAGIPITDVLPLSCPDSERKFKGADLKMFVRLSQMCVDQTGLCGLDSRRFEVEPLNCGLSATDTAEGATLRPVDGRELASATVPVFKDLWEPEKLSVLRDTMEYDGKERLIQRARLEGWTDAQARENGVAHGLDSYSTNRRDELLIHDPDIGWSVVIPHQREDIFRAVVKWLHEHDHPNVEQQYRQIRRRFFWDSPSRMMKVIREIHNECIVCATRKRSTTRPSSVASPITVGNRPFEVISIDPKPMPTLDRDSGCDSVLVVCDRFTGYTLAIPHHQDDDAIELARLMERYVYNVFGLPKLVLSDHDAKFASDHFQAVHKRMGIKVDLGTPYHYKTSGGVENRIRTLQDELNILSAASGDQGTGWYDNLPRALHVLNSKEGKTTGLSPASLLYGYRPTSPIDLLTGPELGGQMEFDDAVGEYLQRRDDDRQQHAERRRQEREKRESDSRVTAAKLPDYEPGHYVVLDRKAFGAHGQKQNKLVKKQAYGPYRILSVDSTRGRLTVELRGEFTLGKTNEFSMEHVRRHWVRRPWAYDTVDLNTRLDPGAEMEDFDHEVDAVSARRFLHGHYKYAVSFKGWDKESPLQRRDAENFEGCQRLFDEFDQKHPLGSLPSDKPEDMRVYKESTSEARARRSTRRRRRRDG